MPALRFAVFGTGYWSHYQIAGWKEVGGVELVALYNRTLSKARSVAEKFGVPNVYDDPEALLRIEKLDFIDIITDIDSHAAFVLLAAQYKIPVICQKPMAPTLETAEKMVSACHTANIPFLIHENWRWQSPLRALKKVLDEGSIGTPFRARIDMISGFPVFTNQPFLRTLPQFIISDLGSHILDLARFLFGEASELYCQAQRVHPDIQGEDVATVMMRMGGKTSVVCNMAYAENYLEHEAFPQTFVFIEGERGSIELSTNYWLRVTTREGTLSRRVPPPHYPWADANYDVVHASIVSCNTNLLRELKSNTPAETSAADNLKTVRLVFAAYQSSEQRQTLHF